MEMDKLQKAELVREKTGASFEDARDALEACEYDVLDAIVWIEQHGKATTGAPGAATYTTSPDASEADTISSQMAQAQNSYEQATKENGFTKVMNRFLAWCKKILKDSVEISFVVDRKGSRILSVPLLLLIILLLFAFWIVLPLLIVGLFFDFKYHFDGLGSVTIDVNDVASKISQGAETIKRDVMDATDKTASSDGSNGGQQ